MERVPEPELMDEAAQARAYARADFSEPHNRFIELFRDRFADPQLDGPVLDLGCGPADISMRFARAWPDCTLHGLDGATAMLAEGAQLLREQQLQDRVHLYKAYLPEQGPPLDHYAVIISNSLLHHLADPMVLWHSIRRHAAPAARVFVMDLQRPASPQQAQALVDNYAVDEPAILQHDFYHSLLAAYTPDEVRQQLDLAGLSYLHIETVSDRHWIVYGQRQG